MKYFKFFFYLFITFLFFNTFLIKADNDKTGDLKVDVYKSENANHISKILEWAKYVIQKKGDKGIKIIADENKKLGDHYIVILKPDGTNVLDPNTKHMGTNVLDTRDVAGNPIIKMILEEAKTNDGGWIHYFWTQKGHFYPEWKTTKVTTAFTPDGEKYILASGSFNIPLEDEFIVDLVNDFIELFKEKGNSSFVEFRKKSSRVTYEKSYLFMLDTNGTILFSPPFPTLESRNMYNYKDYRGKYLFREIIAQALKNPSGSWIEYYWEDPKENLRHLKLTRSYIKSIKYGNQTLIVCGSYFK